MTQSFHDAPAFREQLASLLEWSDAHASYDSAVKGLAPTLRGIRPHGLPHSAWEILEHLRITQRDILDFCLEGEYHERRWPGEYWPARPEPPDAEAWESSVARFRADRAELRRMTLDGQFDLLAVVPHGERQTYLREILLVADHTAYHVGQLVLIRRLLGAWPEAG